MSAGLNLLILPLLGGFLFNARYLPTRAEANRRDGQRLILNSAVPGVLLLVLAYLLATLASCAAPDLISSWTAFADFPGVGVGLTAFAAGPVMGSWLNGFHDEQDVLERDIERAGDALEMLFFNAIRDPNEQSMVAVTMNTGKVYVGWVVSANVPLFDRKNIELVPLFSGYRSPATRRLKFTTDYTAVYESFADHEADRIDDFRVVIQASTIVSAFMWQPDIEVPEL